MASGSLEQHTRDPYEYPRSSLATLLSNTLILRQISPYLSVSALLNIAATSRTIRYLLFAVPDTFRHIDLTSLKAAQFEVDGIDRGGEIWRNVQLDENLTEDDFYSGPLRGIFYSMRRANILDGVQTLVLDGLSVTAELVNEILVDSRFNVRILSIREAKNLNERKLMQCLRYACRAGRMEGMPRLRGLYVFGKRDTPAPPPISALPGLPSVQQQHAQIGMSWNHKSNRALKEAMSGHGDDWYYRKGRILTKPVAEGWAEALLDCQGIIHFDAVLCTGPRHQNSIAFGKVPVSSVPGTHHAWSVATFALGGCATCGSAPEGSAVYGDTDPDQLPLLAPLPLHSSSIKAALRPRFSESSSVDQDDHQKPAFVARCWDCVRDRYCFSCDQWWCEACYQVPTSQGQLTAQHVDVVQAENGSTDNEAPSAGSSNAKDPKIKRDCWECQTNCLDCIAQTQRHCKVCGGGYCIIHYEGSTMSLCDWCSARGRRIRELY